MEAIAKARYLRISPRKLRRVINTIRGDKVENALNQLHFMPHKASSMVEKTLHSAVANFMSREDTEANPEKLYVKAIYADGGPTAKRIRPAPMGRAYRVRKRTSHLTVVVTDEE